MRGLLIGVGAIIGVSVLAGDALARDILVPQDHRKLQDAIDAARPGDRVLILKRRVRGRFHVWMNDIEIVGQERGTRFVGRAGRGDRSALTVRADDVTVRGIDFVRCGMDGSGHRLTIEDCTFSQVKDGVRGSALLVFADDVTVRDVEVDVSGNERHATWGITVTGDRTVVEDCTVLANSSAQPIHLEGDDVRLEGCTLSKKPGGILGFVMGEAPVIRGNVVEGSEFGVLANEALVEGNTFRDIDFGNPALFVRGNENEVAGNRVLRPADSGIVVYGDANVVRDNTVEDAGSEIRGVRFGNGFVVRGTGNLLAGNTAARSLGEGFRIAGNTDMEVDGGGIFVPGAGATALGRGNHLVSCTGVQSGRCGLGNWTLGTEVTNCTFTGNGADVVDSGGFDTFTGNTWNTGGPGWAGDGSGVLAPDWGDVTFDPSQLGWD